MKKYALLIIGIFLSISVVNAKTTDLYEMMKSNAVSDEQINFNQQSSDTNGKGIYVFSSTKNDTHPIYYYRGNVNNNIAYKGFCWQVVRTTENGGIKVIYRGKLKADGSCYAGGEDVWAAQAKYGDANSAYAVGYMYTLPEETGENLHDSPLKAATDAWFEANMLDYLDEIEDAVYCNDRSRVEGETDYYSSNNRLNPMGGNNVVKPSLECTNKADRFTVSSSLGNGKLKYPVGNITADEVVLAGAIYETQNSDSYIFVNKFWTMTPHSTTKALYPNSLGALNRNNFNYSTGVRPVITLKAAHFNTGDGSVATPYNITDKTYDITTNPQVLAALNTNVKEARPGDTVTLSVKNVSKGYGFGSIVLYDGEGNKIALELTEVSEGVYEFTMPESDVYVDVILTTVNPETYDNTSIIVIILIVSTIFLAVLYTLKKGVEKFE